MTSVDIELTAEQESMVTMLVNAGKSEAYEELLEFFSGEQFSAAPEDPHYGYYIKFVIDEINSRYEKLQKELNVQD